MYIYVYISFISRPVDMLVNMTLMIDSELRTLSLCVRGTSSVRTGFF